MPLPSSSLFQDPSPDMWKFPSRRSVVHSTEGIVACTQPLAAKCGLDVLRAGGNAADAAVAVAAGLNMTEPCSTGIGGDMFVLFWDAATKQVKALNGSGRSGAKCTLEAIRRDLGIEDGVVGEIPMKSAHAVTVPGAAAGWVDTVERFGSGKVDMARILGPAIRLGEQGFPVSEVTGRYRERRKQWTSVEAEIRTASPNFAEMLKRDPSADDGVRAPRPGEIMKNPTLARTFRTLADEGKQGFYTGRIARELVQVVRDLGGRLELDDLQHHLDTGSETVQPLSLRFCGLGLADDGVELWEHPPNGQGIVALMALGIIQELEKQTKIPTFGPDDFNSAPYLHAIIEALRLAFADAHWFVTDPVVTDVPAQELVSEAYLADRASLFDPFKAAAHVQHGDPLHYISPALRSSDTVYLTVTDAQGNAASLINSNYTGFGTCIIPRGCGFTLQNRGTGFSLDSRHPNRLEPRKRPYHTIIPAMVTNLRDGSLHSTFGVMGGFMQPQGHVQVLLGQLVARLSPQQALDAPRVCVGAGMPKDGSAVEWTVNVEEGMPSETVEGLRSLGHSVTVVGGVGRAMFGRGQIVRYTVDPVEATPIWSAGSDMRADGAAYPA